MAAFALYKQSYVVVTETLWPTETKIFTSLYTLQKKFDNPCYIIISPFTLHNAINLNRTPSQSPLWPGSSVASGA